jgi:hypothetical protein
MLTTYGVGIMKVVLRKNRSGVLGKGTTGRFYHAKDQQPKISREPIFPLTYGWQLTLYHYWLLQQSIINILFPDPVHSALRTTEGVRFDGPFPDPIQKCALGNFYV